METLNLQTASEQTRNQVEALSRGVQALWSASSTVALHEREQVLLELTRLESDVERLHNRGAIGSLRDEDHGELWRCAERLAHLERHWPLQEAC